uniref:Putative conserved secreted protein n=1 Tax=Ixodes ricinus TaxID=34613 RepID=A0A6B0V157_IXORI
MATLLAALPVGLSVPSPSLSLGSSLPLCAADLTSCSYPSLLSLNNMVYFAGWLVTRFVKFHTCQNVTQQCELQIKNATFSDESQVLLYLSVKGTAEGDFGSLSVPSPCFVSFVEACKKIFVASVDSLVLKEGVGKALCITLHEKVEKLLTLCSEDVYNELFALFARVRLYWFARKKNTELLNAAVRRKTKQQVQRLCR